MIRKALSKRILGKLTVKRLLKSIVFVYLAIGIFGYFFADTLLFRPFPSSYQDRQEIIKLKTVDNEQISAFFLPNPEATHVLLYSHGNAEDLGDLRPLLGYLQKLGFAIFAYDYHGYGTSKGRPSEQNTYRDIDAAYNYLTKTLKLSPDKIILYGRSVGAGPSTDLATRRPVAGLILESAFVSAFRVMTQIPLYPFDKFANLSKISSVHCPVLIIHGTNDGVIPFWHGQELFKQANQPKQFFAVEGADHNNIIEIAGEDYPEALNKFEELVASSS